jgi:uncharacterized protein (TIGR02996 family)
MTSEDFLTEILAGPDDDVPRLIFADWLEERSDPRGEFIRVQCELATLSKPPRPWRGMYQIEPSPHTEPEKTVRSLEKLPHYRRLLARQLSLLLTHCADWVQPLGSKVTGVIFRRGFVEGCSTEAITFAERAADWYRVTPIRQLHIKHIYEHLALLLESRFLRHVDTLEFEPSGRRIFDHEAMLIAGCPNVVNLRRLHLGEANQVTQRGVRALLESPYLKNLKTLRGGGVLSEPQGLGF